MVNKEGFACENDTTKGDRKMGAWIKRTIENDFVM